jgi:hypothetical protein
MTIANALGFNQHDDKNLYWLCKQVKRYTGGAARAMIHAAAGLLLCRQLFKEWEPPHYGQVWHSRDWCFILGKGTLDICYFCQILNDMLPVVRKCGWNDDDIVSKLDGPTTSVILSIAYMSLLKISISYEDTVEIFGKEVLLEQQVLAASAYQIPKVCEHCHIFFSYTF